MRRLKTDILFHKFIFIVFASLLAIYPVHSQQKQINASTKKKLQAERAYKKAYARARERTIKHRYDIQTKSTQEMMDAAYKRAEAFNKQNDPKFLERIFKRKRAPKR